MNLEIMTHRILVVNKNSGIKKNSRKISTVPEELNYMLVPR